MYSTINAEQRRVYSDIVQAYQALEEARTQSSHYRGYMTWKKAKGKEYLFKGRAGARGLGKSLGPKNEETIAQHQAFYDGKQKSTERVKALEKQVELRAKYAQANRLNRVPREATRI